jgi:hypothetical protein
MRILIPCILLFLPSITIGQLVRGRVVDVASGQPLKVAQLELLDDRDRVQLRAVSDSLGTFRLRGWTAGKYRLRTISIGYRTVTSDLLELMTGEEFELTVRMAVDAVPVEPITIVSRSRNSLTEIALRGYYDRRDMGRRIGIGRYLDRAEIEQKGKKLTDVLQRVPGLRIVRSNTCTYVVTTSNPGGTNSLTRVPSRTQSTSCDSAGGAVCPVNVYLDGMLMKIEKSIDDMIPLEWVEAIEVYRRASEMPAEFLGSGACGVVGIWTRRG